MKGYQMAFSDPPEPPAKTIQTSPANKPREKPEKPVLFTDFAII
jgi:hypothetical protein